MTVKDRARGGKKIVKIAREVAAYTVVGIINFGVQYGSYYLLLKLGVYYEVANIIAYLIVTVNSYILYTLFVFKPDSAKDESAENEPPRNGSESVKRFIKLMVTNLGYLLLNSLLIVFFVNTVKMSEETALLACITVLTPYSFFLTKLWVYKS